MSDHEAAPTVDSRPPCTQCGESMEGEHYKRTVCSVCKPSQPRNPKGRALKPAVKVEPPGPGPMVTPPVRQSRPAAGAIKIKVEPIPPPDEIGEAHEYWLGCMATCPIQNVTAGGICFPLFTGVPSLDDKSNVLEGTISRGGTALLTEKQVDAITGAIALKVLRFSGKERKAYVPPFGREKKSRQIMRRTAIIVQRDEKYVPRAGDEPLAAHLYMIRTDAMDFHGREREPESMLQE